LKGYPLSLVSTIINSPTSPTNSLAKDGANHTEIYIFVLQKGTENYSVGDYIIDHTSGAKN
jgi:hypothetical protein